MMEEWEDLTYELEHFRELIIALFHYSNIPQMLGTLMNPASQTVTLMLRVKRVRELS